jgi:hypothetical protein
MSSFFALTIKWMGQSGRVIAQIWLLYQAAMNIRNNKSDLTGICTYITSGGTKPFLKQNVRLPSEQRI